MSQTVNKMALRRYEEFIGAIETVRIALEGADPLIKAMHEHAPGRPHGWKVPDKKEVVAARTKATELLDALRAEAKKWEKELVSRGWRV
ncbi:MAG TPA: hypothetical protein VHX38_23615 [Pseudonocardiaceae bacterium]|nr:hypothetical protein [Pseudonocardiaceae bacterium]